MTAGHGITHSERTAVLARTHTNRLFGIQSWVALPKQHEEAAPDFTHCEAASPRRSVRRRTYFTPAPCSPPGRHFQCRASMRNAGP